MPDWRDNLDAFFEEKKRKAADVERSEVNQFIVDVVAPAFEELREELEKHGRQVIIRDAETSASIKVEDQGEEELTYRIHTRLFPDRVVPIPEVRFRERRGYRFVRTEGSFRASGEKVSLADVKKQDIIANFLSFYLRQTRD